MGKFLRCRNNEALKSWRCMDTCAADWMKQWTTWSMSRLINESMKAWTLIHWVNEAMNQCISQSMKQCLDESTKQWSKEGTKVLLCMSEILFLLSDFFTERPLCWGTSSLSYFSEQPLICASWFDDWKLVQQLQHKQQHRILELTWTEKALLFASTSLRKNHENPRGGFMSQPSSYLMMGLKWCGWHDGVSANHDHRP